MTQATPTGYRPWLDGTRAVAIAMVLIEHAAPVTHVNFGGTGVGIFFALSGYLITQLLINEFNGTPGKDIDLKGFYIRRFARLMPALVLLVVVSDAAFLYLGMAGEAKMSIPALFYAANYATVFAGHHIYGYGHTWSLAVEEHFYLLWPLLLLFMLRRFELKRVMRITIVICASITAWRLFLIEIHAPSRLLYVGSLERADSILYGAAMAMAVSQGFRPKWWFLPAGVLAVIYHLLMPSSAFNEVVAPAVLAVGVSLAIWAIELRPSALARKLLGYKLFAWVGVMSYGIYLWHGTLLPMATKFGDTPIARTVAVALSFAIAYLSYRYFESPIRLAVRSRLSTGHSNPKRVQPGEEPLVSQQ